MVDFDLEKNEIKIKIIVKINSKYLEVVDELAFALFYVNLFS
jgi:hypothetical protein